MFFQRAILIVLSLLGSIPSAVSATTCIDAEKRLKDAITVFSVEGPKQFIDLLAKGGPLEGDSRLQGQSRNLDQIGDFYGGVRGHTLVSVKPLGKRVCYIFFFIEYENGPAFATITMYKMKSGITAATSFFFRTEPENFYPLKLLLNE